MHIFADTMNNKLIFTFFIAFLTFTSGCKKEKEQPPAVKPTYYGKITCLVNGQEWQSEPEGSIVISSGNDTFPGLRAIESNDSLSLISCRKSDSSVLGLEIFNLNTGRTGLYLDSNRKTTFLTFYETMNDASSDKLYVHRKMRLEITSWDEANRRFSGTFQSELRSISGNKTLYISNGKFDNVLFERK